MLLKKRIMIALEAMSHEFIMEAQPKNITRWFEADNIHPAVTWGLGSRPSCAAYLGGMLPICQIPECYHRQIATNWANPFFLSILRDTTRKLLFFTSNGWTLEPMLPWMDKKQIADNFHWIEGKAQAPSKEMVKVFLEEEMMLDAYYAYFHFAETHYPFHGPGIPPPSGESIEERMKYRKPALDFVDSALGPLFIQCWDDAEIVLCSDHNLPPLVVSAANDTPSPKTMLSFIATNFTTTEKTYDGDHLEWAKKRWTS